MDEKVQWPDGWFPLGATDDGIKDSISVDPETGDVIHRHSEQWTHRAPPETPGSLD